MEAISYSGNRSFEKLYFYYREPFHLVETISVETISFSDNHSF